MEAVTYPVSQVSATDSDNPPRSQPIQCSVSTQSPAARVQPVNAPIAQLVGTNNVSTNLPASAAVVAAAAKPREVFIQGVTSNGRTFRPSDWAERLAGAMSCFRPGGALGPGAHIGYSPYCVPTTFGEVKCVVVNEALRDLEPMAWDFVMNFARDNDLQVVEGCLLPDLPASSRGR